MQEKRSAEPKILALAGVVAVAVGAQFFPYRPIPAAAALAIFLSWLFTRAPGRDLGLRWPLQPGRLLGLACLLALGFNLLGRTLLWPPIERLFGPRDLSYLGPVAGNFDVLIGLMPLVWLSAALGEEIVYRGFLQQRLERVFGESKIGNASAILLTSAAFACNHSVQGPSGIIITGLVSCLFGAVFIASRHNLLLMILIHGIWNTFSLTLRYLEAPF